MNNDKRDTAKPTGHSQPPEQLAWCFMAQKHYNIPAHPEQDAWYLIIRHIHIHSVKFRLSLGFTAASLSCLSVRKG